MQSRKSVFPRAQGGYSFAEVLVVVAIIGIVSLVSVPQFIAYQRSSALKSSMRQVMNDLRFARQKAIVEHRQTRLRFAQNANVYVIERNVSGTWTTIQQRQVQEANSLVNVDLPTATIGSISYAMVVFQPSGQAVVSSPSQSFRVRTAWAQAKTSYQVVVAPPGFIKAQ